MELCDCVVGGERSVELCGGKRKAGGIVRWEERKVGGIV